MTDTLTPLHEELDASLARILLDIEVKGRMAVWDLDMMFWEAPDFFALHPAYRTYDEQRKLRERWEAVKGINYAIPGARRHGKSHAQAFDMAFDEAFPGIAGQRIIGNEPWHFEYTAPKLPWWKKTWLYRSIRRWFR